MKQFVKIGQTDYTVLVLFRDSTTGLAKTGLTGASAGMNAAYTRVETDNDVTIAEHATLHALATPALTDSHLDWGFIEVDATHAPGLYRLDIPDEAFATGAWSVVVSLVCTGCDTVHLEFMLIPEAPYAGAYIAPVQGSPVFTAFSVTNQLDAGTLVVDGAASTGGTTTLNALTVTNATTHTGTTVHTGNVSFADGITVAAPSTGNRAGVTITGNGTGAGITSTGGATGPGVLSTGGGDNASADGLRIVAGGATASGLEVDRLNVTGTTALTGAVTLGAACRVTGEMRVASLLCDTTCTITGATTLTGAVTTGTTVALGGTLTLAAVGAAATTLTSLTVTNALTSGTNAVPWNAAYDVEVQSEVNDALVATGLDHLCLTATAAEDMTTEVADGTIISRIIGNGDTSTFVPSTDGLRFNATEILKIPKSDSNVTWNATALGSINTQVVDGLNVDTYAEPAQGAPAATATLAAKVNYLYKAWRNKKMQDATTFEIYNDAGDTVDHKATVGDDGTDFTFGEIVTGP